MSSVSKKEKDLYKSLDKLYIKNKSKIISWLDELKKYKSDDGKISGLLNNSKIQILTATEDGTYNLILQWIKNNADKFADYDFTGIPDSAFISSADLLQGPARSSKVPLTFQYLLQRQLLQGILLNGNQPWPMNRLFELLLLLLIVLLQLA